LSINDVILQERKGPRDQFHYHVYVLFFLADLINPSIFYAPIYNMESSIFLLPIFFATQIIGGAKELAVLLGLSVDI